MQVTQNQGDTGRPIIGAAPAVGLLLLLAGPIADTLAAAPVPDLAGVWSGIYTTPDDPRWRLEDFACMVGCRADVQDALAQLLADPTHADDAFDELVERAERSVPSWSALLTASGRARLAKFIPADDPSLRCEPKGLAREVTSPYPLAIEQTGDGLVFHYEQWQTVRAVELRHRADAGGGHALAIADGAASATRAEAVGATRLGRSIGHYEHGELVIETAGIAPNLLTSSGVPHSDALRTVERYRLSEDGGRLELELTLYDPIMLVAPLVMRKAWVRTPGERILEERCEVLSGHP